MKQETKDIFVYLYYHHRRDNSDYEANISGLKKMYECLIDII